VTDAQLAGLLPVAVVLPIGGAVLAIIAGRIGRMLPAVVGIVAMLGSTTILALLALRVFDGHEIVEHLGHWRPVGGSQIGITFVADPFAITFALLTAALGTVLLLDTLSELGGLGKREMGGYACLVQLLLAALIGSAVTADALNLFVWFEVAALASYGLTGFLLERPVALEAALKIAVLTNMAAFFVFVGVGLLYGNHGAVNFGQLQGSLGEHVHTADLIALALLISGFATKAGLMPFHGWLADAHSVTAGPISALFSGLMVNLGVFAIARFTRDVYPELPHFEPMLVSLGCLSAVLGAALALAQDDLKRVLAYDTVSQMGVLLAALGLADPSSLSGMVYHLVDHAMFKALMFLCAGAIVHATGMTELSQMGGLWRIRPVTTAAFTVGALSVSGVPPFNGFVSVGTIHDAFEHAPTASGRAGFVLLTIAQVLTVAALARATWLGFYRHREDEYDRMERPKPGMVTSFGLLAAGCVALGCVPFWFLHHVADPAAATLVDPHVYDAAAMGHTRAFTVEPTTMEVFYPSDLALTALMIVVGLIVAWWYVHRASEPRPISWLRRLHNGSANEYASWSVLGLVVLVAALGL
jgi:multicomponent Na+:H+ antiporter subunit D